MVIQRIFGTSISGHSRPEVVEKRMPIDHIRSSLRQTVHDCTDIRAACLVQNQYSQNRWRPVVVAQ